MACVFALPAPGDAANLWLQGKGRFRRKTLSSHAPVSCKLFIFSHMQESRNRATRCMINAGVLVRQMSDAASYQQFEVLRSVMPP